VEPGLSVEGVCTNRECEAFDRSVIINKQHGTFDLLLDAHAYVSCVMLCDAAGLMVVPVVALQVPLPLLWVVRGAGNVRVQQLLVEVERHQEGSPGWTAASPVLASTLMSSDLWFVMSAVRVMFVLCVRVCVFACI
jgi:hypothetical protein